MAAQAVHVVGVVLAHAGLVALFEANVHVAVGGDAAEIHVVDLGIGGCGPGCAELVRKFCFLHFGQEVEILENPR